MLPVPELSPKEVGTPIPVQPHVLLEEYTYDYIIVGGGTAGCVLASRLSENPTVSVLVIEQGPVADTWTSRNAILSGNPTGKDYLGTQWWSQPLRHADNRFVEVVRGEALGGSSRINAMLYTRGTPGDYNRWKELGNEGWSYDDLEPYFVRSEHARTHPKSKYRGKNGVWEIRQLPDPYRTNAFVDRALKKAGIEHVDDFNDPGAPTASTGVLDCTRDRNHTRHSTYRAFLPPDLAQKRRTHLKICPNTLVTRIEFSGNGDALRATGMHFETTSARLAARRYLAKARREIIICAGAFGSPQLLMLSGIGPKEHLLEKGIPVVRDMPAVGSYLQDHIGLPVAFEVPMSDSIHELESNMLKAVFELLRCLITGGGLFSQSYQNTSTFVPSRLLDDTCAISDVKAADLDGTIPENRPDIELMHIPHNCADVNDDVVKGIYTLMVGLIRPKSQGTVRLATSNPRARPDVDLGYLSEPEDYVPLRKGVRLALRLAADVRKQGYPMEHLSVPDGDTDEDVDRFIRGNLRTCYHYTSTCRMGREPHGARPSVVDTQLKVHGIRGLRVCDASVFPEIIASHTMAPVVAVAEKCADMIKAAM